MKNIKNIFLILMLNLSIFSCGTKSIVDKVKKIRYTNQIYNGSFSEINTKTIEEYISLYFAINYYKEKLNGLHNLVDGDVKIENCDQRKKECVIKNLKIIYNDVKKNIKWETYKEIGVPVVGILPRYKSLVYPDVLLVTTIDGTVEITNFSEISLIDEK